MLTHIHIKNFAIIDKIEVDLDKGETVLTGETGAGKSILLDALGMVLGDRADTSCVRQGEDRAEISATFDIQNVPEAAKWLNEQALDSEDECILRRVITQDGRSRGFINGQAATLQSLKTLGEMLVDIHGQHEHQSLLKKSTQRQRLDDYAGHDSLLSAVQQHYTQWHETHSKLEKLKDAEKNRSERLNVLRYQVEELEKLNISEGEMDALEADHKKLANASKLIQTTQQALNELYESDDTALHSRLNHIHADVTQLSNIDESLQPVADTLNAALINIEESADALRSYTDKLDIDPTQLQTTEERMGVLHETARKHRVDANELPQLFLQLSDELNTLENADVELQSLQSTLDTLSKEYLASAEKLHRSRVAAAKDISQRVTAIMQELGMEGGLFDVSVEKRNESAFAANGLDDINFNVSANRGQAARPLGKVASGGELSRISLAIQMITANNDPIPTLIFDEVDAGIGGGVAEIVGQHLRALGEEHQVLCVTHLPQVAAQAHQHLFVSKLSEENNKENSTHTRTAIRELNTQDRIQEVARMLGGVTITEQTLNHAKEMLGWAKESA